MSNIKKELYPDIVDFIRAQLKILNKNLDNGEFIDYARFRDSMDAITRIIDFVNKWEREDFLFVPVFDD